jgi:plasmid stabilization system protein ParE
VKLVYSQDAVSDLIRLRDFIAEKDPSAAARVSLELVARIDYICSFPNMGKAVALSPEPLNIRDAIFGKYVVRYVAQAESIIILRVWHHYETR